MEAAAESSGAVEVDSGAAKPATRRPAVGRLETGWAADVVILDGAHPALAGADAGSLAETLLLAGSPALVRQVWVGGVRVVEGGRHTRQEEILGDFRALQRRIWSD